ncbi:MAG: MFS transporter [Chloroflexi bacterium]|nr:MFS transporter [Chloroflexota bacterium]
MSVRIHQGVVIAFVVFLSFTLTVGITQYSFGVFVTDLEGDLGWSRAEITAAVSFFALVGIFSLPAGWLLDRYGARPVMAASLTALAVSYLLRPLMTEVWQFYALNAIQFAAMPGAVIITAGRVVGEWFEASRGRAMGLTAMGANFGGIIFSSLTATLITTIGWRSSYFVYGLLFAALVPVVILVVRDRRSAVDEGGEEAGDHDPALGGATVAQALRSRPFWLVTLALVLATMTYGSVLPQVVPHLENEGVSKTSAAAALSLFALFGMCGKVSFGWMTERLPSRYVMAASIACQVTGLWVLLAAGSASWFWAAVPVFGLGFGALGALMPLLVQETFGLRAFGTIFGLINFATLGSALAGPLWVGASFEETGSYRFAFMALSVAFVVAAATVAFARPYTGPSARPTAAPATADAS